jgi:hypothetical protein
MRMIAQGGANWQAAGVAAAKEKLLLLDADLGAVRLALRAFSQLPNTAVERSREYPAGKPAQGKRPLVAAGQSSARRVAVVATDITPWLYARHAGAD